MYVTIPVTKETKKLVDDRKEEMGLKTYDETIAALARPNPLVALKDLKGILAGTPPFERDRSDRTFD